MKSIDFAEKKRIECALQNFYDNDYVNIAQTIQTYNVKIVKRVFKKQIA